MEAFCGLLEEEEEEEEARVHVFALLPQMLQTTIIPSLYCYCSSAAPATFVSLLSLSSPLQCERASERAREGQKGENDSERERDERDNRAVRKDGNRAVVSWTARVRIQPGGAGYLFTYLGKKG